MIVFFILAKHVIPGGVAMLHAIVLAGLSKICPKTEPYAKFLIMTDDGVTSLRANISVGVLGPICPKQS